MDYREMSAKNVDEAITKACLELGIPSDELDYEVLNEGSSGFFGIGSHDAVIRFRKKEGNTEAASTEEAPAGEEFFEETKDVESVYSADEHMGNFVTAEDIEARAAAAALRDKELGILHGEREERPERRERNDRGGRNGRGNRRERNDRRDRGGRGNRRDRGDRFEGAGIGRVIENEKPHEPSVPKPERKIAEKSEAEVEEIKKTAREFLETVFKAMDMEVEITMEYDQKEGSLNCDFAGEEMGLLIGKRGQTLDSLQYLTSLTINKGEDEYIRVKLDTEDYRSRRRETLENLSRNIAYKVRHTRKAIALEPMNPYERRIIHAALQSEQGIETYSEGEEPYRHVVVTCKKEKN